MRTLLMLCLLCCSITLYAQGGNDARSHILKVYNWADYMDQDLIEEFQDWYQEQTGEEVKIIYSTFDINENMLTEIEVGHEDYDVVCPSEYIIERMLKNGLIQKLDFGDLQKTGTPNWIGNASPWAVDMFQRMSPDGKLKVSDYTVGYMWGTTGILYNRAFVSDEEVQSWSAIHNPRFKKQIYVKDAFRDVFSCLIQFAKQDSILNHGLDRQLLAETYSDQNLMAVQDVVINAKPQIAGFETDFGKERMSQGKVWLNISWSGDAQWAIDEEDEGVDLAYVVPQEGSNAWFDGWVIPKYAQNVRAATYFINFMCKPENAVRNMEETGYVSVVGAPEVLEAMQDEEYDYVDASYFFGPEAAHVRLNEVMYPDKSVIERCILMHDGGERNEALFDMWERVKGNNLDWKMLTFVCSVLGLMALFLIDRKVRQILHKRRRQRRLQALKMNHPEQ